MASVYERITSALSSLGKRRNRESGANDDGRNSAATPEGNGRASKRFRPWDQADLHRRLETYKPLTWFAKPDSVGPVPCAMRGWVNDGCDVLSCEHCNAKLKYPPQVPYDQRQAAADLFSPSLASKHAATCPWRQTQCSNSVLAYLPDSTNDELCEIFKNLHNKLLTVDVLPDIDAIAIQAVRDAAMPYGSYDDLVVGLAGSLASPRRLTSRTAAAAAPSHGGTAEPGAESHGGSGGGSSSIVASPACDPAAASTTTYIIQPSKLSPQQKARLLALLGWDLDVLQPDSAGAAAAAPYTQSAGYSLQHLGIKPKKPLAPKPRKRSSLPLGGGGCGGYEDMDLEDDADPSASERHPMSSVVLKCNRCNSRMGLWNFAGVRPVPTGRLTPAQQAAGAAALLSPRAPAAAAAAAGGGGGSDPLSMTIAGGQYGPQGAARAKPFGVAAAAAPFRFGSASSAEPVFGVAALDAEAQRSAANGFGSPLPGSRTTAVTKTATATTTMMIPENPPNLTGQKRKAAEQAVPEPMAVDGDGTLQAGIGAPSSAPTTPAVAAAASAAGGGGHDNKRQRLTPFQSGTTAASPLAAAAAPTGGTHTPGGEGVQLRELDPVGQHRHWCPWVYTGTPTERTMSGWQHMLRALSSQQQQPQRQTSTSAPAADAQPAAPLADPKQLRDQALATIRSL